MNKYFEIFLCLLVCLSVAGCSGKKAMPVPESAPSAPPELESIVEPIERPESVLEAYDYEAESEAVIVQEPEPELTEAEYVPANPEISSAPPEPVESASAPATSANQTLAQSKVPEILKSVAPEQKLDSEKVESELLRLINELRGKAGAEALGVQEDMRFAARIRSFEALSDFSHTRPDGTPYNTAFDEAGFTYAGKWHGENLSSLHFTAGMFDEKTAAAEMFNGLKDSPGHYQNMVGVNFFQTGIGVSISYENGIIDIASAQLFSSL